MATEPLPHLTSYRQLLAATEVRALLAATLLSRLAGRMFSLTIVLYGVTQVHSTVVSGWLAFAAVAPGLIISPIAGSLIDGWVRHGHLLWPASAWSAGRPLS